MPTMGLERERRSWWRKVLQLLTLVLLLPVLPLFGVAPGEGSGGDGDDGDEDPGDSGGGDGGDGDGDDDDEFDRERAMATIRNLRGVENAQKKELRDALKKLEALEKAQKKRDEEEMSELEKAQALVKQMEQAAVDAEAVAEAQALEVNEKLIKAEVRVVAATMQFASPEDAYHLADLADVSVEDDGSVKGVEKALKALAKDKAYLLSGDNGQGGVGTPPRGGKRSSPKGEPVPVRVSF